MNMILKARVIILIVVLGMSLVGLHTKAACNNANSQTYNISSVVIDMTSPDEGEVYKHDVCYFTALITKDNPAIPDGGFTYQWSGGTMPTGESSTKSTYQATFTKGTHSLSVAVTGNDVAVNGVCSASATKQIVSKPYKFMYTGQSLIITQSTKQGFVQVVGTIEIELEGDSESGPLNPTAEMAYVDELGYWGFATAYGSWQLNLEDDGDAGTQTYKYEAYHGCLMHSATIWALTSPNNVGGDYGTVIDS